MALRPYINVPLLGFERKGPCFLVVCCGYCLATERLFGITELPSASRGLSMCLRSVLGLTMVHHLDHGALYGMTRCSSGLWNGLFPPDWRPQWPTFPFLFKSSKPWLTEEKINSFHGRSLLCLQQLARLLKRCSLLSTFSTFHGSRLTTVWVVEW